MGYEKIITLAERCAKYTAACGKRSILETKPVGKVEVSKLGVCLSDGSVHFPNNIIRYKTVEEAENAMKQMLMRRYKVPLNEQAELSIAIKDKDLYIGYEGVNGGTCIPHTDTTSYEPLPIRIFDSYHQHPYHPEINGSTPLSANDISNMIEKRIKSVTAFNKEGEFSTARIVDINKLMHGEKNKYCASADILETIRSEKALAYMGKDGERLIQLRELKQKQSLPSELEKELSDLENKFETFNSNEYYAQNPNEYCKLQHNVLKKVLPQFGIEYKTNFSNLLKYDA